jgi:uncharacterized protein (UPF0335 family)
MYNQNEWDEIIVLKKRIEERAFLKTEIHYKTKISKTENEKIPKRHEKGQERQSSHEVFNQIRIINEQGKIAREPLTSEKDLNPEEVVDLDRIMRDFTQDLAELIWRHKRTVDPEAEKLELSEMKDDNLSIFREDLKSYGFSNEAIQEMMNIASRDIDSRIEKYAKVHDMLYFLQTTLKGHRRIKRENDTIEKIRELYRDLPKEEDSPITTLSDRDIASNMAFVFDAADFWPDQEKIANEGERLKLYFYTIRNRFRSIKKR